MTCFMEIPMQVTAEKMQGPARGVRMVVMAAILSLAVLASPGRAYAGPAADAGVSVDLVNESRAHNGLAALIPDWELQVVANRQAQQMAGNGYIYHSSDLESQLSWGWRAWAENVGYGSSVGWIHERFMNSGYHAANILHSSYNYIGVGVAYGSDGNVYVAQVFGRW